MEVWKVCLCNARPFWLQDGIAPYRCDINPEPVFIEELIIYAGRINDFLDGRLESTSYLIFRHDFLAVNLNGEYAILSLVLKAKPVYT